MFPSSDSIIVGGNTGVVHSRALICWNEIIDYLSPCNSVNKSYAAAFYSSRLLSLGCM